MTVLCRVSFLDESEIELKLDSSAKGEELFTEVCKHLNIVERDYFGLISEAESYKGVWVRAEKPLKKQFREESPPWSFKFFVKFYPSDPGFLKEEITKYQLCLQIRDDLLNGRLPCPMDTLAALSSYWLQSEFGDGDDESDDVMKCLSSLRSISDKQTMADFETKVLDLYKKRKGMPAVDADTQFLRLAAGLPLYGVHRYEVEDKRGSEGVLGVSAAGIVDITTKHDAVTYKWNRIKNINYKKTKFYLKLLTSPLDGHSVSKCYKLKSSVYSKALWHDAVDHHMFFRVTSGDGTSSNRSTQVTPSPGRKLGGKRKLSFRNFRKKRPKTEADAREESANIKRSNPTVIRSTNLRRSASLRSETSSLVSSSTSETHDDKQNPKLRSILKKSSPRNDNAEEHGEAGESETVPVEQENFLEVVTVDVVQTTLLFNETIPEEDEDILESPTADTAPKSKDELETPANPAIVHVEDAVSGIEQEIPPVANIDEESSDAKSASKVRHKEDPAPDLLLPPPLVEQRTKDSFDVSTPTDVDNDDYDDTNVEDDIFEPRGEGPSSIAKTSFAEPIYDQSPALETDDVVYSLIVPSVPALNQGNGTPTLAENTETQAENAKSQVSITDSGRVLTTPSTANSAEPEFFAMADTAEDSTEETTSGDREEEDDSKTIGSAMAVLGDEDRTLKDFVDDGGNERFGNESPGIDIQEYHAVEQTNEESFSSHSSISSISDITNDTDELCNPNIIDIIWAKTAELTKDEPDNNVYYKLFGVRLRPTRGRLWNREVKSNLYDGIVQKSIGVQFPPLPEDEQPAPKKFVPSWPFHPDSAAAKAQFDELDQEAINAALHAHTEYQVLKEKIAADVEASALPLPANEEASQDDHSSVKSESTISFPEFAKSVELYYLHSSTAPSSSLMSSRRESADVFHDVSSSESADVTVTDAKQAAGFAGNEEGLAESDISCASTLDNVVSPRFPDPVKMFSPFSENNDDTLVYFPEMLPEDLHLSIPTDEDSISPHGITSTPVKPSTPDEKPSVIPRLDLGEQAEEVIEKNALPNTKAADENYESGRSSPSSVASSASSSVSKSSFPRFIQSVFPWRSMSSSSESGSIERGRTRHRIKVRPRKVKSEAEGKKLGAPPLKELQVPEEDSDTGKSYTSPLEESSLAPPTLVAQERSTACPPPMDSTEEYVNNTTGAMTSEDESSYDATPSTQGSESIPEIIVSESEDEHLVNGHDDSLSS